MTISITLIYCTRISTCNETYVHNYVCICGYICVYVYNDNIGLTYSLSCEESEVEEGGKEGTSRVGRTKPVHWQILRGYRSRDFISTMKSPTSTPNCSFRILYVVDFDNK